MGVWLVGVDTGGTFTDLIAVEQNTGELRRAKVPSVSERSVGRRPRRDGQAVRRRHRPRRYLAVRSRNDGCNQRAARRQGRTNGPADHAGLSRGVRGARLVAAARQRSARHVLSKAAVAGVAVADRRGARAAGLSRRGRHPARRSGAARLRAPPEGEGRRSHRRVLPVLVPQSRARAARGGDRCRDRAGVPHLACRRTCCRSSANIHGCRRP